MGKKKNSFSSLSLKRKVWVAVSLVSLIPIILALYHFYGTVTLFWYGIIFPLVLIVFLGWGIIFRIFSKVSRVHDQSQDALSQIGASSPDVRDEVQGLENAINLLSDKVKDGFAQLKDFTHKTEELNKEISHKVVVLSTILQANDLFSKGTPAQEIIKFLDEHLKQVLDQDVCFCILRENISGNLKTIDCVGIDLEKINGLIKDKDSGIASIKKKVLLDSNNEDGAALSWAKSLDLKNLVIVPIVLKKQVIGLVGVGNKREDFSFSSDELDVLGLFSQNLTLIWEHEKLSSKVETLEIVDYLTGLYNERMITKRLDEEIKRATAYQRPCGFLLLEINNYSEYQKRFGLDEGEQILKNISQVFKESLKPIDIAGRLGSNTLGAILIENNKRQTKRLADELQQKLKDICGSDINLSFAIAESPVDGTKAKDLIVYAKQNFNI